MDIFGKDKVILGIAAHPDDLDFGCSGTMAKAAKSGASCYYLILTDGSKGSEDLNVSSSELTTIRHTEQKAAGKVLGLKEVFFLDYIDGELENTPKVRKDVVRIIRKLKPDVVITMDPSVIYNVELGYINHPDHRKAGEIALESVFPFARNSRSFPELLLDEGHEPHSVKDVLLINFSEANFYIDISDTLETKLEALSQHKSQHADFSWVKNWVTSRASRLGKRAKSKYAEGFVRISVSA